MPGSMGDPGMMPHMGTHAFQFVSDHLMSPAMAELRKWGVTKLQLLGCLVVVLAVGGQTLRVQAVVMCEEETGPSLHSS